jgi:hypothetical protein
MSTRYHDRSQRRRPEPGSPRTCRQPGRVGGYARSRRNRRLSKRLRVEGPNFGSFYLLRTGCASGACYPASSRARARAPEPGRLPCRSVVILDSQSVKTTESRGTRGFDGRKRQLLVDTLGMVVARRSKPPMCRTDAWGRCCLPAYNPASRASGR